MPDLCPICPQMIGQSSQRHNGVCIALPNKMQDHVKALYQHRDQTQLPADTEYNGLPFNQHGRGFIWKIRCFDVRWVMRQLRGQTGLHILEVGAWNGWLSHHLAHAGHWVTALEYSDHPTDGLGAKQFYNLDWHTIQMDPTDLYLFKMQFDVVIINHGLHYFTDPIDYVKKAQALVAADGRLFLLNLIFHKDPTQRIQQIRQQATVFETTYHYPYFLQPSRGYMDLKDRDAFIKSGVQLRSYPNMWRANLKAQWIHTAPRYQYGYWKKTKLNGGVIYSGLSNP